MNTALQYYRTLPRVLINEKDLCILSFFKENTVDTFAEAARNVDNVAFDVVNFANRADKELIYTDLQDAPISQFGYITQWNDQTGNGRNAVTTAGTTELIQASLLAFRVGNNQTGIAGSDLFKSRDNLTINMVVDGDFNFSLNGSRLFSMTDNNNGGLLDIQANRVTRLITFFVRRITTESYTTVTMPFFSGMSLITIDIDFAGGSFSVDRNGVQVGTETLISSGSTAAIDSMFYFGWRNGGSIGIFFNLYHFEVSTNLTAPEKTAKETALIARYVSTALLTGGDIYQLFDVIISPDRLSPYPYAMNVRRSSDNTEQVISHVNGLFDVASFDTFKGAGDGFATRVLDQATPQRAFTQAEASVQLQIVSNLFNGRAGFQGNNAARRSIAKSFSLNTKVLHYYFFIPCQLDSLSGVRDDLFAFRAGSPVRMGGGIVPISGNARLNTLSQRVDADVVKQVTGTTNIALATKVLLSYAFDFENGIIRGWINQDVEINDTTGHEGTSIGQVSIIHFMNVGDNSIVAFNGKTAGIFYVQGEQTDAQLEAIRTELLQTYIL